ncbi:MAG TPA: hypothetical protein VKR06_06650 [Ktedonosporobacter sp.]|nr:hypothetical protein [Ktedonosporobacter sp.]
MRFQWFRSPSRGFILLLPLLLVVLAGCWPFPDQSATTGTPTPGASVPSQTSGTPSVPTIGQLNPKIDDITQKVLGNISQHGWNPQTNGLYTNWRMSDPSQTQLLTVGADNSLKHDPQVDLFYLQSLADYHALHPQDHQFDSELDRTTKLVLSEIRAYSSFKGWMYFFLQRSGALTGNQALESAAQTFAQEIYTQSYDPSVQVVYNRKAQPGNYNPNLALQAGAAMIDAGTRANQPDLVDAGKKTLDHVLADALNPQYKMLYNIMNVVPGGQDQPLNNSRYKGFQAKPSTQGEGATALIMAYNVTHEQKYLDAANQLLQTTYGSSLWDQQRGGFYFAFDMDTGKLEDSNKETRSQNLILIAMHNYDQTMQAAGKQAPFVQQEQQLISLLTDHFYEGTYHGFLYRLAPDFQLFNDKSGEGDVFTTEAMGSATDALQQTEFATK